MKRIAFILLLWSQGILAQQKDIVTPGSNLVIEGIPDIPVSIKNDVQRYTESRGASFSSWHPTKKQMIISTRFANVPQLHVVQMPMGDRKQVTFYEDAITNASYEPIAGKYFLFTKDIGGNEFSQLYRFDVATGEVAMISDGGRYPEWWNGVEPLG